MSGEWMGLPVAALLGFLANARPRGEMMYCLAQLSKKMKHENSRVVLKTAMVFHRIMREVCLPVFDLCFATYV